MLAVTSFFNHYANAFSHMSLFDGFVFFIPFLLHVVCFQVVRQIHIKISRPYTFLIAAVIFMRYLVLDHCDVSVSFPRLRSTKIRL